MRPVKEILQISPKTLTVLAVKLSHSQKGKVLVSSHNKCKTFIWQCQHPNVLIARHLKSQVCVYPWQSKQFLVETLCNQTWQSNSLISSQLKCQVCFKLGQAEHIISGVSASQTVWPQLKFWTYFKGSSGWWLELVLWCWTSWGAIIKKMQKFGCLSQIWVTPPPSFPPTIWDFDK